MLLYYVLAPVAGVGLGLLWHGTLKHICRCPSCKKDKPGYIVHCSNCDFYDWAKWG